MYTSLKDGWVPLADLCDKYNKDKGNMNRVIDKIKEEDKEKIGNIWIVRESEFVKYIKTDIEYSRNKFEEIDEIVDKFTTELSKKINMNTVQSKFTVEHITQGDYIMKTILEWSVKCHVSFPVEIYKYIEEEELYTKCLIVTLLWNKTVLLWNKTLKQK